MRLEYQVRDSVQHLGLEEYLKRSGVDDQTINENKNTFACTPEEKWFYYDYKQDKNNVLVPVPSIAGVSRMKNFTWFDLLNYGAAGAPKSIRDHENFNVNSQSFWRVLSWLENNSLGEVKARYENTGEIKFYCLQKGDKKRYYLIGEGNHRVVTAKNLGVPRIIAENVEIYEYNEKKHRMYEDYKRRREKLYEIVKELRLSLTSYNQVAFFSGAWYGFIGKFTYSEKDLNYDFSRIEVLTQEVDTMLARLNNIKKEIRKYKRVYSVVPDKVRGLIKKFIPSEIEDRGISHIIALQAIDERNG